MIGAGTDAFAGHKGVVGLAAAHGGKAEAGTEAEPLDRRHGEYMAGHSGFDVFIHVRAAQTGGQAEGEAFDDAAHGIAFGARFKNGLLHGFAARIVDDGKAFPPRRAQGLHIGPGQVEGGILHTRRFSDAGEDFHALLPEGQLGHGSGKDERRRETAGKMPSAPVILKAAVAQVRGEIRMAGPGQIAGGGVVARAGVGVFNESAQGRAAGSVLEYAAYDAHRVLFTARRGQRRIAGGAARHLGADEFHVQGKPGGNALQNNAYGRAVGFAEQAVSHDFIPFFRPARADWRATLRASSWSFLFSSPSFHHHWALCRIRSTSPAAARESRLRYWRTMA